MHIILDQNNNNQNAYLVIEIIVCKWERETCSKLSITKVCSFWTAAKYDKISQPICDLDGVNEFLYAPKSWLKYLKNLKIERAVLSQPNKVCSFKNSRFS